MSNKIQMLKDSSWGIKGKIKSFKDSVVYTQEEVGDDKVFNDMLKCGYAALVKDEPIVEEKKMIKGYENKAIEPSETKTPKKKKNKSKPKKGKE